MTILVGVLCSDGVVIGADSAATFGNRGIRTIEQPYKKLNLIGSNVIVTFSGEIGLGQRFIEIVRKNKEEKIFPKSSAIESAKLISREFNP